MLVVILRLVAMGVAIFFATVMWAAAKDTSDEATNRFWGSVVVHFIVLVSLFYAVAGHLPR